MTKLSILLRIIPIWLEFSNFVQISCKNSSSSKVILFLFLTFRNKAKIFSDPKNKCTTKIVIIIISQKSGGNDCALIAKLSFFMGGVQGLI